MWGRGQQDSGVAFIIWIDTVLVQTLSTEELSANEKKCQDAHEQGMFLRTLSAMDAFEDKQKLTSQNSTLLSDWPVYSLKSVPKGLLQEDVRDKPSTS